MQANIQHSPDSYRDNNQHNLKCLVAEDVEQHAQLVIKLLQQHKVAVTHVRNGRQAIKAFNEEDFDFIVMDLQMPGGDGFEAVAAIRRAEAAKAKTPVIALTAETLSRNECVLLGFDELIHKPFITKDFIDVLQRVCGNEVATVKATCNDNTQPRPQHDFTYLKAFSHGDEAFEKDMIVSTVADINNGLTALNDHIKQNNPLQVGRTAHSLKSLAAIIGCNELFKRFGLIEKSPGNKSLCQNEIEKVSVLWNNVKMALPAYN